MEHLFFFQACFAKMLYVIVTARSLLWMLTSLIATLLMLAALANPAWLEAPPEMITNDNHTIQIKPSIGVYARCSNKLEHNKQICTTLAVQGLATDSEIFPSPWKAAVVFICFGLTIMCTTVFSSLLSSCFQSCFRKSIFTMSGSAQAVAGTTKNFAQQKPNQQAYFFQGFVISLV